MCIVYIFQMTALMLVWMVYFSRWLILVRALVSCCWLSWPLTLVTQSGGRKLTSKMVVAIRNLHGYFTVKQTHEKF